MRAVPEIKNFRAEKFGAIIANANRVKSFGDFIVEAIASCDYRLIRDIRMVRNGHNAPIEACQKAGHEENERAYAIIDEMNTALAELKNASDDAIFERASRQHNNAMSALLNREQDIALRLINVRAMLERYDSIAWQKKNPTKKNSRSKKSWESVSEPMRAILHVAYDTLSDEYSKLIGERDNVEFSIRKLKAPARHKIKSLRAAIIREEKKEFERQIGNAKSNAQGMFRMARFLKEAAVLLRYRYLPVDRQGIKRAIANDSKQHSFLSLAAARAPKINVVK